MTLARVASRVSYITSLVQSILLERAHVFNGCIFFVMNFIRALVMIGALEGTRAALRCLLPVLIAAGAASSIQVVQTLRSLHYFPLENSLVSPFYPHVCHAFSPLPPPRPLLNRTGWSGDRRTVQDPRRLHFS